MTVAHAAAWKTVWASPGERMLVQAQVDTDYTRHRYVSNSEGNGAVAVAVQDDRALFIRIYRPATGKTLLELPRGQRDLADQDSVATAKREIREETGWQAADGSEIAQIWPDSGLCGDHVYVVMLTGLAAPDATNVAEREISDIHWLNATEIRKHIADGLISDGITLSALVHAGLL